MADPLLRVEDLAVSFATEEGVVQAVDGVSFDLAPGEVLAVVGESGSGKSVTAMTLMGLTRSPNARFEGTAHYKGTELIGASEDELRRVRGAEIAMIFQDPMTSLNPVHRIGRQIMIRHVLRNSMIPIITLWGLDFGAVIGGGAILTETVFDLQGVGQYTADAIGQLDVPPVLATTLFAAFFIVLLNAVVDILYAYLDPRIRLQ